MDHEFVKNLMWNWAIKEGHKITHCPPEAKVITGNYKSDGMFHYLQIESGLELELTKDFNNIKACKIVNEEQFTMFVLKWS